MKWSNIGEYVLMFVVLSLFVIIAGYVGAFILTLVL